MFLSSSSILSDGVTAIKGVGCFDFILGKLVVKVVLSMVEDEVWVDDVMDEKN
jgi:hypothetical protein